MIRAADLDRLGDWDTAATVYAQLFQESAKQRDLWGLIDALRGSAHARRSQGKYEEAEDLAELRREIAMRFGFIGEAARATRMIGVIRHIKGDLESARALYEETLERLRDVGDDEQVGFTCQNLGVVANVQGDLRQARALYLESISAAIRAGNPANAMQAYNNLALVCADLRDWMEAEVYFDRGIEIAEQLGHVPMLAKLRANRAEPLIHTGQFIEANKTLTEAERLASPIRELGTLADITRFRSTIARKEGDFRAAEQHIAHSLQLAKEAGLDLERAEASEEHACLLAAQGRTQEAVSALRRAQDGFRTLGAERDVARTQEALESLLSADGAHFTPSVVSV